MVHFYHSIPNIALVCIIREEYFDRMGLIEYNLQCVSQYLMELYKRKECVVCSTKRKGGIGEHAIVRQQLFHDDRAGDLHIRSPRKSQR